MDGKKPIEMTSTSSGVISLSELYSIEEAKRRLGWTASALRSAKRRGLRLLRSGKRRYLTGSEILRFLEAETADCQPDRDKSE